jgi:uncharacterized protein YxeA
MKATVIIILVLLVLASVIFIAMWLEKKGALKDSNNNYIPDVAEDKAKNIKKETKKRLKRVSEETKDVLDSLKEVGNQIGDIPSAIKGEDRKGRKK